MLTSAQMARHLHYDKETFTTPAGSQGEINRQEGKFIFNGRGYKLEQCAVYLHTGRWYDKVQIIDLSAEHPFALDNLKWRYLK